MGEFRPSYKAHAGNQEFRPSYKAHAGNQDLENVDAKTLKTATKLYVGRSRSSFDPAPIKKRVVKSTKSSSHSVKEWWNDPEMKRRRRVAKYKFYAIEGKFRYSVEKGLRWIKKKCSNIVHGS